jgi:Tetratricopeptide repeat
MNEPSARTIPMSQPALIIWQRCSMTPIGSSKPSYFIDAPSRSTSRTLARAIRKSLPATTIWRSCWRPPAGSRKRSRSSHLSNLAQLLQATSRLEEAKALCRRALAIDELSFGPNHPRVATHLNNLALLLKTTGQLEEGEALYRRALAIDELRPRSSQRRNGSQQSCGIARGRQPTG